MGGTIPPYSHTFNGVVFNFAQDTLYWRGTWLSSGAILYVKQLQLSPRFKKLWVGALLREKQLETL
jgi:hypothetical protein